VIDAEQLPQMCERLLVNPLIEDYEIQFVENDSEDGDLTGTGGGAEQSTTGTREAE
jgi:hypothetical protein